MFIIYRSQKSVFVLCSMLLACNLILCPKIMKNVDYFDYNVCFVFIFFFGKLDLIRHSTLTLHTWSFLFLFFYFFCFTLINSEGYSSLNFSVIFLLLLNSIRPHSLQSLCLHHPFFVFVKRKLNDTEIGP